MKKLISAILITLLINMNVVYAENWVTITSENGKSADLDLDSVQMVLDAVEYNIRTQKGDYVYINKMSTELYKKGLPTAAIERAKYKNNTLEENKIENEKFKTREYKSINSGTLQAEIFDVLSKELDKKTFTQGQGIWDKYLKRQRKIISKGWEPSKYRFEKKSEFITPVYINYESIIVDKNGVVKDKKYNHMDELYSTQIEELPEDYTADTFQIDVNMNYYKYAGAKLLAPKQKVKQISPTHAQVSISKNHRPPVIGHIEYGLLWLSKKIWGMCDTVPDNNFVFLISIPFYIVVLVGGVAMFVVSALFGVDTDDI